eukprot:scaffold154_cov80-Skeletonema_dohrnii-CCMP3373.AAC.3
MMFSTTVVVSAFSSCSRHNNHQARLPLLTTNHPSTPHPMTLHSTIDDDGAKYGKVTKAIRRLIALVTLPYLAKAHQRGSAFAKYGKVTKAIRRLIALVTLPYLADGDDSNNSNELQALGNSLILSAARYHGATDKMISIDWKADRIIVTVDVSGDGYTCGTEGNPGTGHRVPICLTVKIVPHAPVNRSLDLLVLLLAAAAGA